MTIIKTLPDLTLAATNGQSISLNTLMGKNVLLYFYPKDSTPGCTREGQDFRDQYQAFVNANTLIFGISRDSIASHEKFKQKQNFPFELLSDADETLCRALDVIQPKNMYGKIFKGIERSTFLFNQKGELVREWRKVKVKGHVDEVLAAVKSL